MAGLVLATLMLVACDPRPAADPEAALRERVEARWQALLQRDYATAYEHYVSPTYRAVFTQRHFYRYYGEQLQRDRVEVVRIDFIDETKSAAKVRIKIHFTTEVGSELLQLSGGDKEHWTRIDGQWYLVPESSGAL